MKPLTPIIQRPQDLILAIVTDNILPPSQILVQRLWQENDWRITFAIIGESHRVRIEHQGQFIMEEMLACADISVQTCQHHHQFSDLQAHAHHQKHYKVQVDLTSDMDLWQAQEDEISFVFPAINSKEAVTKLQWQALETSIQWRTLHTYYYEGATLCVYSQSEYTFQAEE